MIGTIISSIPHSPFKISMQTIFITGIAGFIGFHAARKLLDEGYTVVGIDNFNDYYDTLLKRNR